jgi:cell division protein FtsQ
MSGARVTASRRPASNVDRFRGRSRRRRLRKVVASLVAFLAVASIGAAGWLVGWSNVTQLEAVHVEGADGLLAEQVTGIAQAPIGEQLIWVDTDSVAARVSELPEFSSVSVHRSWPRTLVISVRQRVPAAAISADGSWWLVDRSGMQFGRTDQRPADLPVLDAPAGDAAADTRAAGVAVLTALPGQLHEQVQTVSAHSPADVRLTLGSGATVLWGGPADSPDKAAVLLALLAEDAATYDVSAPSRPAVTP